MSISKKSMWQSYRFPIVLLFAIGVGSVIGVIFGEKAMVLKPLGTVFLNLMFTIVVPLVFVTIASAVGGMVNMKRLGRILVTMFGVFIFTGLIASLVVIPVVKIWPPAQGVSLALKAGEMLESVNLSEAIVQAITVSDFSLLLSKSNMMPLIVFAILFGFCLSAIGEAGGPVCRLLDSLSKVIMKVVDVIMLYAPIGLGAYFASLVGELGPELLGAYGRALIIYYPLCALYFLIAFPIYVFFAAGKTGVSRMFRYILPPTATSLATQSSIATLPVNLEAAGNIGVSKDIREIVLPIGATMHMDGTVISSILKISFLFGLFGLDFSGMGLYVTAIAVAILGGVVMSGIPGGGLVGEMLIVSLFGFPPEAFPVIATIGFLVDPAATCLNSTGDTIASMMVSRFVEGKDWLKRKLDSDGELIVIERPACAE